MAVCYTLLVSLLPLLPFSLNLIYPPVRHLPILFSLRPFYSAALLLYLIFLSLLVSLMGCRSNLFIILNFFYWCVFLLVFAGSSSMWNCLLSLNAFLYTFVLVILHLLLPLLLLTLTFSPASYLPFVSVWFPFPSNLLSSSSTTQPSSSVTAPALFASASALVP